MPEIYMLDTDVCSYIIKNRPADLKDTFLKHKNDTICISAVTYAELLYGLEKNPSDKLERAIDEFVALVRIIDWNHAAARKYAIIRHSLTKRGLITGSLDMQIAASAMATDAQLVTNNRKHFEKIEGLRIADWL
jgi:tRNA(fMet)-specific endonuclease VapC